MPCTYAVLLGRTRQHGALPSAATAWAAPASACVAFALMLLLWQAAAAAAAVEYAVDVAFLAAASPLDTMPVEGDPAGIGPAGTVASSEIDPAGTVTSSEVARSRETPSDLANNRRHSSVPMCSTLRGHPQKNTTWATIKE